MGESPSSPTSLMARIAQIMQPSQNELYFTRIAILVEGIEDIAFISTHLQLSNRWSQFREFGCHFVVGDGKTSLSRALAICKELDIPAFVVFDSDAHQKKANDIKNNKRDAFYYIKDSDEIHRGGEGRIMLLTGKPDFVAKLYHSGINTISEQQYNFLTKLDRTLFVVPEELLSDGKGKIAGFTMKYVGKDYFPLSSIFSKNFCTRNNIHIEPG